jgi:SAM-dependent methyltransferase
VEVLVGPPAALLELRRSESGRTKGEREKPGEVRCSGRVAWRSAMARSPGTKRWLQQDHAEQGRPRVRSDILPPAPSLGSPEHLASPGFSRSPETDVISTFDVLHDAVDPRGLLRTIRGALRPDGIYVCMDMNCSDRLEENLGPLGTLFHGFSVLYCLTTSLAHAGEGLGTVGLPESKLRELSLEAGFSSVHRVQMRNPFSSLYVVRP